MLETGRRPLHRTTLIVALANALEIAPSELTRLPLPAPANGHTDSSIEAIRLALDAIDVGQPGGLVLPVAVLRDRVAQIHAQRRAGQSAEVAADLPELIRDLHTTLVTGADHGDLLGLAVYLHVHVTRLWLSVAFAPADLLRRTVFLAKRLAEEHGEAAMLGMAGFAVADTLLCGGAFEPGRAELDALTLPPTTADTAGLVCWLTMTHALAAVLDGRPDDAAAPMDAVAEVAERFGATGEADSLGIVFGPTDTGVARMSYALEVDEPDRAVSIAQDIDPNATPSRRTRPSTGSTTGGRSRTCGAVVATRCWRCAPQRASTPPRCAGTRRSARCSPGCSRGHRREVPGKNCGLWRTAQGLPDNPSTSSFTSRQNCFSRVRHAEQP